jgi:glycosyltransferase involved in cell wall biosynthesis
MPAPRVSAIIRTHNRAPLLAEAIDSVLVQTLPGVELLVVDDGSTDGTRALLADYGDRLRAIYLEHSGNPAAVGNAGLRAAAGEYIAFLDSDDLWLPDKLARQLARLDAELRFGFSYGNVCLLEPDGRRSAPVLAPDQIVAGSVLQPLVRNMCVHISTLVVRRACLDAAGWFDERHNADEDLELLVRLARAYDAVCIPEPVALIRRHGGQRSAGLQLDVYEAAIATLSDLREERGVPLGVRLEARRTIARYHSHIARRLIETGERAAAGPHLARALRANPFHRPAWGWLARWLAAGSRRNHR